MGNLVFKNILEVDDELKMKVREWRNKNFVKLSMITQHDISIDEHNNWLNNIKNNKRILFFIVFSGNIPIGSAYLTDINWSEKNTEWGFYIGEQRYLGHGWGKKILHKLCRYVFEELNFKKMITRVLNTNPRALNLYIKKGFNKVDEYTEIIEEKNVKITVLEFTTFDWEIVRNEYTD